MGKQGPNRTEEGHPPQGISPCPDSDGGTESGAAGSDLDGVRLQPGLPKAAWSPPDLSQQKVQCPEPAHLHVRPGGDPTHQTQGLRSRGAAGGQLPRLSLLSPPQLRTLRGPPWSTFRTPRTSLTPHIPLTLCCVGVLTGRVTMPGGVWDTRTRRLP